MAHLFLHGSFWFKHDPYHMNPPPPPHDSNHFTRFISIQRWFFHMILLSPTTFIYHRLYHMIHFYLHVIPSMWFIFIQTWFFPHDSFFTRFIFPHNSFLFKYDSFHMSHFFPHDSFLFKGDSFHLIHLLVCFHMRLYLWNMTDT